MNLSDMKGGPTAETVARGYEETDVSARSMFWFAVIFVVLLLGTLGGLYALTPVLEREDANRQPPELPAEPRLQQDPRLDYDNLQHQYEEELTTYRWIDENTGVVGIPIDRAMHLTLERGLPVREEGPQ